MSSSSVPRGEVAAGSAPPVPQRGGFLIRRVPSSSVGERWTVAVLRRVATELETASRHELPHVLLHLAGAVREVDEAAALTFQSRLSV